MNETTIERHPFLSFCETCVHRQEIGGRYVCEMKGVEISNHLVMLGCPIGKFPYHLHAASPVIRVMRPELIEGRGPALWADLHRAALAGQLTPEWLAAFANRVPCGECREHWLSLVAANPLAGDPFEWTWQRHQDVNARLGKPGITLDEARAFFARAATPE